MAAMRPHDLIVALSQEAGDSAPRDVLVDAWETNHGCCCALHIEQAALGDTKMLNAIRSCMGLRVLDH